MSTALKNQPALSDICLAYGDDWVAVYSGDEKIHEGHSVSVRDLLEKLGHTVSSRYISRTWLEENGDYFPDTLSELTDEANDE